LCQGSIPRILAPLPFNLDREPEAVVEHVNVGAFTIHVSGFAAIGLGMLVSAHTLPVTSMDVNEAACVPRSSKQSKAKIA
jgi:hypothetical protein